MMSANAAAYSSSMPAPVFITGRESEDAQPGETEGDEDGYARTSLPCEVSKKCISLCGEPGQMWNPPECGATTSARIIALNCPGRPSMCPPGVRSLWSEVGHMV